MVGGIILKTPKGIDWSQNVLDFYHFGEIPDLFRGRKSFILTTVALRASAPFDHEHQLLSIVSIQNGGRNIADVLARLWTIRSLHANLYRILAAGSIGSESP